MKKNNKGFTMIELLAAIVLLGILAATAIAAVSWILQRSKDNYYVTLEKNVTMAAENYYVDNRAALPKAIGQSRRILLKTLVEKNYLKEVVDYNKDDCTASNKSYIKVVKYSNSDYIYKAYFDCPGYKTTEEEQIKDINIQVSFDYEESNINDATAKIKISSTEDNKIASFEYTIYKDGQHVYQSENINAGYVENVNRTVELNKYVPGNIRVVVTAYDIFGNKKTVTKETSLYNNNVPECGTISPLYNKWETSANASRTISVNCVDTSIKCLRKTFSETFTGDIERGYITILGENYEERKCPVNVYLDSTPPACGSDNGSTVWTKGNREIVLNCIDETSGCEEDPYTKTYNKTTTTDDIEIKDKAGNTNICSVNVYVDKNLPICGNISEEEVAEGRKVTIECSDNESGCTQPTFTQTVNNDESFDITIQDNAGNTNSCTIPAKTEDKTPPACPSIEATFDQRKWTKENITFTFGFTEDTESWEWYTDSNGAYRFWDHNETSDNSRTISGEGKRKIKVVVYDEVGNSQECFTDHEYWIDKTAPSCPTISSNIAEKKWTNQNITFTFGFPSDTDTWDWFTDSNGSYRFWDTNSTSDNSRTISGEGKRKIRVVTRDSAGNTRYCFEDKEYWIDKTPPNAPRYSTTNLTSGNKAQITSNSCFGAGGGQANSWCAINYNNVTFYFDTVTVQSDNLSGVAKTQLYWDHDGGGTRCPYWFEGNCGNFSASTASNPASWLTFQIRSVDNAGNVGYSLQIDYRRV